MRVESLIEKLLAQAQDKIKLLTLLKLPTWPNSRIDELLPFAPDVIEALMKPSG